MLYIVFGRFLLTASKIDRGNASIDVLAVSYLFNSLVGSTWVGCVNKVAVSAVGKVHFICCRLRLPASKLGKFCLLMNLEVRF